MIREHSLVTIVCVSLYAWLDISRGRVISTEFMELPSKKDWPFYYKEIKRPQCIENIFVGILTRKRPKCNLSYFTLHRNI